jgi:hypothetical protein
MVTPLYWRRHVVSANTIGFGGGEALEKFATLFLFVKASLIDWALAGENGNKEFCRKRQVQVSNIPRSPQFRTEAHLLSSP